MIIYKVYTNPGADGCTLLFEQNAVILANITSTPDELFSPRLENPRLENPRLENATVALSPGETANVLLRVFDPNKDDATTFDASASVTAAVIQQSVNTEDAAAGITTAPIVEALTVTTPTVPDALIAVERPAQQLTSNVAGSWSLVSGTLPPGLTLSSGGLISGTPTTRYLHVYGAVHRDCRPDAHGGTPVRRQHRRADCRSLPEQTWTRSRTLRMPRRFRRPAA